MARASPRGSAGVPSPRRGRPSLAVPSADDTGMPPGGGMPSPCSSGAMSPSVRRRSTVGAGSVSLAETEATASPEALEARRVLAEKKRCEMEEGRVREREEGFARAEARRQEAAEERRARPKREAGAQRAAAWLQALCGVVTVHTLRTRWCEKRALATLRRVLLPMLRRWRYKKAERRVAAARRAACDAMLQEAEIQRPSVQEMKRVAFFKDWDWNTLSDLLGAIYLQSYDPGEFVVMEGDWGRCMYLIHTGTVEVTLRKPGSQTKSHTAPSRLSLAKITEKSDRPFFGEFSLLANEPRSASCVAATPCLLWVIDKEVVDAAMQTLSANVRHDMDAIADSRRAQILAKIHPVNQEIVAHCHPMFACWTEEARALVVTKFEARVCAPDTCIVEEGDPGTHFFLVASGTVSIRVAPSRPHPSVAPSKRDPPEGGGGGSSPPGSASSSPRNSRLKSLGALKRTPLPPLSCPSPGGPASSSPPSASPPSSVRRASTSASPPPARTRSLAKLDTGSGVPSPRGRRLSRPSLDGGAGGAEGGGGETSLPPPPTGQREVARLGAGAGFGEVAVLFLERRTATAVAVTKTDLWQLPKAALIEILMMHPQWFMEAKKCANTIRARYLQPPALTAWLRNADMSKCIPQKIWKEVVRKAKPVVVECTGRIGLAGEPAGAVYLLAAGDAAQLKEQPAVYGPGSLIGVAEALTFQRSWMTTVVARTKCDLWCIETADLVSALAESAPAVLQDLTSQDTLGASCTTFSFPPQSSTAVRQLLGLDKNGVAPKGLDGASAHASTNNLGGRRASSRVQSPGRGAASRRGGPPALRG